MKSPAPGGRSRKWKHHWFHARRKALAPVLAIQEALAPVLPIQEAQASWLCWFGRATQAATVCSSTPMPSSDPASAFSRALLLTPSSPDGPVVPSAFSTSPQGPSHPGLSARDSTQPLNELEGAPCHPHPLSRVSASHSFKKGFVLLTLSGMSAIQTWPLTLESSAEGRPIRTAGRSQMHLKMNKRVQNQSPNPSQPPLPTAEAPSQETLIPPSSCSCPKLWDPILLLFSFFEQILLISTFKIYLEFHCFPQITP